MSIVVVAVCERYGDGEEPALVDCGHVSGGAPPLDPIA